MESATGISENCTCEEISYIKFFVVTIKSSVVLKSSSIDFMYTCVRLLECFLLCTAGGRYEARTSTTKSAKVVSYIVEHGFKRVQFCDVHGLCSFDI